MGVRRHCAALTVSSLEFPLCAQMTLYGRNLGHMRSEHVSCILYSYLV